MRLLSELGRALLDAGSMTWQITWSLILGFTLSAVIQAVVRREAVARHLGSSNTRTLALATGLGAASSSCSYTAVASARALVRRGASFITAMAFEFAFDGLGLVPAERGARVTDTGITWNYTTILNVVFLLVAAALFMRFVRSGSAPMLTMMGGCPEEHARDHSEVLLHDDAQPAQQVFQTQVIDHQDTIAVPSMGKAPAPTVRPRY